MADTRVTVEDLKRILLDAAGADEGIDLSGDINDTPFDQLGYDSLALLETSSRIQREYGVELDDDAFLAARTPEALIEAVNERLAAHA
ncbi:acyl carrier protein [Actinoplanes sp. NBRC 103695]|uniref:acyl carrier protein n=1 Tax=Actinoplanes sp. NBRC 103695 TaxID=3032202 RepID=UPI0024A1841D|nr:acyl carrier protein [Actinoplanes sp. NBRC 103695]GLZ00725.1 actinorhodin polyketide synthase acyl carrier protein [Actinoplanes sp. NBRC 103695]